MHRTPALSMLLAVAATTILATSGCGRDGVPRCGDGILDQDRGEECDDGNLVNDDSCSNTCKKARCGDGIRQSVTTTGPRSEGAMKDLFVSKDLSMAMDTRSSKDVFDGGRDGKASGDRGPARDGQLPLDTMAGAEGSTAQADSKVSTTTGEECDDGNSSNNDSCTNECRLARCGDGYLQLSVEECDDGNRNDTDGCTNECKNARCGDGVVQKGEECDDGNRNNTDSCLNTCLKATCGDGYLQKNVEECDDGNQDNSDACLNSCKLARCGDAVVRRGVEACDDGNQDNTDGCTSSCALPTCGDGVIQKGEECDDGNKNNTDLCLNTCLKPSCGDGYVQKGAEECDDGNKSQNDACTNSCKLATCGDGYLQVGVEECDDGNAVSTDACTSSCKKAACGDGVVQAGVEECDDGNKVNTDSCLTTCKKATCGDGYLQASVEECDDSNTVSGDWCSSTCKRECQLGTSKILSSGRCYMLFSSTASWGTAAAACVSVGGHLASIASSTENAVVAKLLPTSGTAWIGLTDQVIEDTFMWLVSGGSYLAAAYTNWASGQPDNSPGNADCAQITSAGTWSDESCTTAKSYVCEYEFK